MLEELEDTLLGECDTCGDSYELFDNTSRCGSCGNCGDHCRHLVTITGYRIAYPTDYWPALESAYPTRREQERAQALGFDHFGRGERCYRCGFLCEGQDDIDTVSWSSSNPTGDRYQE